MTAGAATLRTDQRGGLVCDQAIFTAVPGGRGYTLVAASPGVTPEERRAIVAMSPSHGGLADDSRQARGLLAYPLPTGRLCCCLCRHGGAEPSGRGGLRVHTHAVLFDNEAQAAAAGNPLALCLAALHACEPSTPDQPIPERLGRLTVALPDDPEAGQPPPCNVTALPGWATVLDLLREGHSVVIGGATDPPLALASWLESLPAALRRSCSFSIGLRLSLSRPVRIAFVHEDPARVRRLLRGSDREFVMLDTASDARPSGWAEAAAHLWPRERAMLAAITNALTSPSPRDALDRLGSVLLALYRESAHHWGGWRAACEEAEALLEDTAWPGAVREALRLAAREILACMADPQQSDEAARLAGELVEWLLARRGRLEDLAEPCLGRLAAWSRYAPDATATALERLARAHPPICRQPRWRELARATLARLATSPSEPASPLAIAAERLRAHLEAANDSPGEAALRCPGS